jgi:hypothetical protein
MYQISVAIKAGNADQKPARAGRIVFRTENGDLANRFLNFIVRALREQTEQFIEMERNEKQPA